MIDPQPVALGDQSEHVEELQRRLYFLGHLHDDVNGYYGDSTVTAVAEFQRASGLTEDDGSAVSAEAWQAIESAASGAGFYEQATDDAAAAEPDIYDLAPGTVSDDGQYQWDGADWQPVTEQSGEQSGAQSTDAVDPNIGLVSEDGRYRWDGESWQPVEDTADTAGTADPAAGTAGAEQAADEPPVLSEEQFAQMVGGSISVDDGATA